MRDNTFENAFDAFFDDPVVANNLKIRADLMIRIEKEIHARQLTQSQAAELLEISQPRVNYLLKGKVDKFSIDLLVNLLSKLGIEVVLNAA